MNKATRLKLEAVRTEFEAWVDNEFMADTHERPDSWKKATQKEMDKWFLNPYEHPWTAGAWEVWKKFNGLPSTSGVDYEEDE